MFYYFSINSPSSPTSIVKFSSRNESLALAHPGTRLYLDKNFMFTGPRFWNTALKDKIYFGSTSCFFSPHSFKSAAIKLISQLQNSGPDIEWICLNTSLLSNWFPTDPPPSFPNPIIQPAPNKSYNPTYPITQLTLLSKTSIMSSWFLPLSPRLFPYLH